MAMHGLYMQAVVVLMPIVSASSDGQPRLCAKPRTGDGMQLIKQGWKLGPCNMSNALWGGA